MNGCILFAPRGIAAAPAAARPTLFSRTATVCLLVSAAVTLCWPALTANAEEAAQRASEEMELLKEEETVSIASRYDQPISEAPSNVYVITDEDIRQSGAVDIPTILRRIPGMEVMQVTGAEFNVSMRGDNQLNANKLLVLVDGRSIYLDVQGTINWKMLPVTLPEIKRIEVLKGPASAVYGFNAFDGVINIITKSPEEMRGNTLQFGGGEFGTISSAAVHAGTQGKLGYRLSVGHDQNQQWRNSDALAFRMNRLNGHTEYSLGSDSKLSVSGGLADANRYDGPIVGAANVGSTIVLSYANVAYERPDFFIRSWWYGLTANSVEAFPAVNNILSVAGTNGAPNLITKGNTYNVEAQHSVTMGMTNKLTYGLNYRHNTLSGTFVTALQSEDRFGLYLQDEWRPTEKFLISAGIRYDLDTFINPTLSPRVALLYKPADDHTFRAAVSIAYRPPTVLETPYRSSTR